MEKWKSLKTWQKVVFVIIIISIIGAFASPEETENLNTKNDGTQSVSKEDKKKKEKYSFVEEPRLEKDGNEYYEMKYIVGTIKNNTSKKTSYIQVTFSIYDKDGNVIGSAIDNVNYIEPGGTWKFKAMILEEEYDSFKFESVSGF